MSQESDMLARALQRVAAQANGEEPATATTPQPVTQPAKRRTVAQIMRPRSEEQGQCPQCGYTAPLDDFDNGDSESDSEGFETDSEAGETDGDAEASKLAKRLLKAAGHKPEQAGEKPKYKELTREEIQEILSKAVKNLRQ
jgi:hypothetical protein